MMDFIQNKKDKKSNVLISGITIIKTILFFILTGFFNQLAAQTSDPALNSYLNFSVLMFLFLVVLTFTGLIYLNDKEEKSAADKKSSVISVIFQKLSGAAPIEKEADLLLEHDFDGIKELDNDLPPWWKYLFYVTMVFGVIYIFNYHILTSNKHMADEYNEEVKIAENIKAEMIKTGAFINEASVTLLKDPAEIERGKAIFTSNCATCHGSKGEGLVGPNLTDDYWIHGGGIKNVFTTVKYGVPAKGMLSWQTQLSPKQMQEVASFVISLHGTNPPNAKPQEGVLYKEPADSTDSGEKKL
jgi:cytochrome c oxidase cbb3-type subunit 3